MSEQFTDEISGGPQRRGHRAVAWGTLAVLGAVAFGGGAYALTRSGGGGGSAGVAAQLAAATSSPNPSSSASPKTNDGRHGPNGSFGGPMMRGPAGMAGPGSGMGGMFGVGGQVLHGESTVQTRDGKTQVVDTQRGTISSLDAAKKTLTVTSTDKVSFTYVTDSNTRFIVFGAATSATKSAQATFADLKQGDTVEITAIRSGDTRTATAVVDGTPTVKDGKDGKGWPGPGQRPGKPAPSTSASGASA